MMPVVNQQQLHIDLRLIHVAAFLRSIGCQLHMIAGTDITVSLLVFTCRLRLDFL